MSVGVCGWVWVCVDGCAYVNGFGYVDGCGCGYCGCGEGDKRYFCFSHSSLLLWLVCLSQIGVGGVLVWMCGLLVGVDVMRISE